MMAFNFAKKLHRHVISETTVDFMHLVHRTTGVNKLFLFFDFTIFADDEFLTFYFQGIHRFMNVSATLVIRAMVTLVNWK